MSSESNEASHVLRDPLREETLPRGSQVEVVAFREIGLLHGAELGDNRTAVNDEANLGPQREGADVGVTGCEKRNGAVHAQVFRVEKARAIEMDVDADGEEVAVIGMLRELGEWLISLEQNDETHLSVGVI